MTGGSAVRHTTDCSEEPCNKFLPWETVCMKCQSLFSGNNKKTVISLSSAELAQRVVKCMEFVEI